MKIQGVDSQDPRGAIRVRGNLRNIPVSGTVTAGIERRIDGKTALLDIGGEKIRAEFTGGLPPSGTINLMLQKIVGDTYVFAILERDDGDELLKRLGGLFILNREGLRERKGEIFRILNSPAAGVFELNRLLIDPDGRKKREDGAVRLFNALLKMGFNAGTLIYLSMIISGTSFEREMAYALHSLLTAGENPSRQQRRVKKDEIDGIISDIINEFHRIDNEGLQQDIMKEVLSLLGSGGEPGMEEGEIVVFADEEFRGVPYYFSENSIIFSLNLSQLGIIEILVKINERLLIINFFSENDDSLGKLKKYENFLLTRMRAVGSDAAVNYFNTKFLLDNLKDFYRNHITNNINVKV